jgi:hypothetical protein
VSGPAPPLQPALNPDTAGFWAATARGELALCWCAACDRFVQPPVERCPTCAGPMAFRPVSGKGHVHSFIVVHRAVVPGSAPGDVIALVELVEQDGLRLATRLVDLDAAGVRIGLPVEAAIVDLPGGDHHIPVFRPFGDTSVALGDTRCG